MLNLRWFNFRQVILAWCVAGFIATISTLTLAENIQHTSNSDAESIVVGQVIQNQQSQANAQKQAIEPSKQTNTAKTAVNHDLSEGVIQRELPTLNEPIIDQANILSATEKQELTQKIYALHQQAKAQIGVVIVPTTGQEGIFDYAMRVATAWKLGSEKNDNGLLIVVALNDRKVQILTGYGLEGVLPDIVLSRIIRENIYPYFKEGQYAQGLSDGLGSIDQILNMDADVATKAAQELKERHEKAFVEKQNRENTFNAVLIILLVGVVASYAVGNRLSAATAAVAGVTAGIVNGMGIVASLLIGLGIFILLITTIAHILLQHVLARIGGGGSGRGGSGGGSSGGSSGYRGGGGGFGGGGASGSW